MTIIGLQDMWQKCAGNVFSKVACDVQHSTINSEINHLAAMI